MRAKETYLFEKRSMFGALLRLVFPTVIGQIILVIYNMADTFFIGMSGNDAMLTAVTICMPAFMFLSAISNLFGVGGASVISRSLGLGDVKRAELSSGFAFWGCLSVTLLYCLVAFLLRHPFLELLGGTDPAVHALAEGYLITTVVIGGLASSMSLLFSHLIRAQGRSMVSSVGVGLGGILNIFLDPLFMFQILPPGNEVLGAAIATALSNLISLCFFIVALVVVRTQGSALHFRPRKTMFRDRVPQDIFAAGIPACVMTLFENISYAVLDKLVSFAGTPAQAGLGVAKKINMLSHSIVRGIAQGSLPLIAYNYSAGNHKRMRKAVTYANAMACLTALFATGIFLVFAPALVSVFIPGASVSAQYGAHFLRILTLGAPFSACAYTYISFFQAVGRGRTSFILAILRKGVVDIPLMLLFFHISTDLIVAATPIADMICCAASLVCYFLFLRSLSPSGRKGTDPSLRAVHSL